MGLFPNRIETMLEDLEGTIHHEPFLFSKVERHDWRPVWVLCKAIQDAFKDGGGFNSQEEQQKAWNRFASLRQRASETADKEKEEFRQQSKRLRNELRSDIAYLRWSHLEDIIFFFDPETVDDMKKRQARLKEAGQRLSAQKSLMLREHKDEIFELMQEVRASFDAFWEKRKEYSEIRRKEREERQAAFEERRGAWERKTRDNIERNRGKLNKARDALDRCLSRISRLEGEIYETTSDKWREIKSGWLRDEEEKRRSIEESIERIQGWIRDEEERLYGS